ncbi:MAG: glycoside hydrolase family 13 protein [Methanobacteriota archaeon]|nr:MAG: glycoside hydrolase family 13 protein [Euryarchaeota archaeon]
MKNQKSFAILLLIGLLASLPSGFATNKLAIVKSHIASNDNNVEWDGILHDSRDPFYRNPGWGTQLTGAVPVGTDVTLRIRSYRNDLTGVQLKYWDNVKRTDNYVPMSITSSDSTYDYWEITLPSPDEPTDIYYAFLLTDGTDTDYYNDDVVRSQFEDNRGYQTGGVGRVTDTHDSEGDYAIVFYDPSFTTPEWHKNAVGYQIFIDRFYNGDLSNDPVGDGSSGDVVWYEWDSNGNGIMDNDDEPRVYVTKHQSWDEEPQGGYDYFGGDLQGVMEKLDYLKELGVDFIWFNPFTEAPDNHGYSVDDYRVLDSYYGVLAGRDGGRPLNNYTLSMEFFDNFSSTLEENGIKIIYDTVINHHSAQGVYFQRYENQNIFDLERAQGFNVPDYYPDIWGAFEHPFQSPYYDWFRFYDYNEDYDAWFGLKHIPTIIYEGTTALEELVTGPNNIFDYWMSHGVDGFRLDVNNMYQDGQNSRLVNRAIRDTVKTTNPDAVVIGEIWERATQWLTGDQNDGTQNMPFRFNTLDWIRGNYLDSTYAELMRAIQENYPKEAFYSLWVNLGNHDRSRVRSVLDGNSDLVLVAATLQFSFPGTPVIWYGDEVGMEGLGDPGTRGTFPWDAMNTTMLDFYKKLIHVRKSYPVLRQGDFLIPEDTQDGVMTFYRHLANADNPDAVVVVNRDPYSKRVRIFLNDSYLPENAVLVDVLNGNATYFMDGNELSLTLDGYAKLILLSGFNIDISSVSSTFSGTSNAITSETTPTETGGIGLPITTLLMMGTLILLIRRRQNQSR